MINILVVCRNNSYRSIMAEALINDLGHGKFRAVSAGSKPLGYVHPKAIEILENHGIDPGTPTSKSWNMFATQPFDLVITVCDEVMTEHYPLFPNRPERLHWSIPDPALATDSSGAIQDAFDRTFFMLKERVQDLIDRQSFSTRSSRSEQQMASN